MTNGSFFFSDSRKGMNGYRTGDDYIGFPVPPKPDPVSLRDVTLQVCAIQAAVTFSVFFMFHWIEMIIIIW